MNERRDIIVANTLTGIGKGEVAGYLCHAYCHNGFCEFTYNNNVYRLEAGDWLIIRRGDLVERVSEREDLQVDVVYVTPEFIEVSTPHKSHGQLIEEFDLLIGSSAVHRGYVMVTENLDHFERIPGIEIENWVGSPKKK